MDPKALRKRVIQDCRKWLEAGFLDSGEVARIHGRVSLLAMMTQQDRRECVGTSDAKRQNRRNS